MFRSLVVADAGVHHDALLPGINDQRMNAHDEVAGVVHEVGGEPVDGQASLPGGIGQDETAAASDFHLDDAGDLDVPNLPLVWSGASGNLLG